MVKFFGFCSRKIRERNDIFLNYYSFDAMENEMQNICEHSSAKCLWNLARVNFFAPDKSAKGIIFLTATASPPWKKRREKCVLSEISPWSNFSALAPEKSAWGIIFLITTASTPWKMRCETYVNTLQRNVCEISPRSNLAKWINSLATTASNTW